jgi:hypothetical protein
MTVTVIVSSSVITDIDDAISVRFGVRGLLEDTLEFKVAGADPSFIADTLEAALLGLLVPAMAAGEDMRLDGPVSEELLFRITNYVVPLLYLCIPGTQPIAIHAEDRRKISLKGEPAVLTGLLYRARSSNFAAQCVCR